MDLNLKGKRVLVTGASKGIGRACVELLEKEGCTVLGASRSIAAAKQNKAVDIAQRGAAGSQQMRFGRRFVDERRNPAGERAQAVRPQGLSHRVFRR